MSRINPGRVLAFVMHVEAGKYIAVLPINCYLYVTNEITRLLPIFPRDRDRTKNLP